MLEKKPGLKDKHREQHVKAAAIRAEINSKLEVKK